MKTKKIKIPIYFGTLVIVKSKDLTKLNPIYNTQIDKSFEAVTFQIIKKSGAIKYIVAFNDKVDGSIISHEVCHLVNMIFKHNYIKLDLDNDEPQAYLHGWLFGQIHKFLNKQKNK